MVESNVSLIINENSKASGFYFDINKHQVEILQKFKEKIISENLTDLTNYNDLYLLRFLRARKFDLDKSYLMFKTFINWRKENNVDEMEVYSK